MDNGKKDFIESSLFKNLKREILYKNRFFCKDNTILEILLDRINKKEMKIEKGTILYRARIMDLQDEDYPSQYIEKKYKDKKGPFYGYDRNDCMQPKPNKAKGGRVNPIFVSYLYTARDKDTAIYEVKPKIKDYINIGYIEVREELKVADLRYDVKSDGFLLYLVSNEFANVCQNIERDYIYTQYISEFLKYNGYDAVEFNSSLLKNGCNVTIFEPSLCDAIASEIHIVNDIKMDAKILSPK